MSFSSGGPEESFDTRLGLSPPITMQVHGRARRSARPGSRETASSKRLGRLTVQDRLTQLFHLYHGSTPFLVACDADHQPTVIG